MADNPLFYRSITPLNRETHRQARIGAPARPFAFAENTHFIPAVIDEFAVACRSLPIVFLSSGQRPLPVFLVGLRPGRNASVNAAGQWDAAYLPAYLRRYPFILGEVEGGDPLICFDSTFEGVGPEGEAIFTDEGGDTPFLKERMTLTNEYAAAAKRTDAFCDILQEMGLLRPITIEAKRGTGDSSVMHGVLAVDEPKLASLSDENYLKLRRNGLVAPIYAHLLSLGAIEAISTREAALAAAA